MESVLGELIRDEIEGFRGRQHLLVAAEIKKNPNKNPSKDP